MLDANAVARRLIGRLRREQHTVPGQLDSARSALIASLAAAAAFVAAPVAAAVRELLGDAGAAAPRLVSSRRTLRQARPPRPDAAFRPVASLVYARLAGMSMRHERLVPGAVVVTLVLVGTLSALPVVGPQAAAGESTHSRAPRIVIEGLTENNIAALGDEESGIDSDGFVDTTLENVERGHDVTDGSAKFQTYVVQPGDTAGGIAAKFGISLNTLYWANKAVLKDPQSIWPGQTLVIPPVNGLIVTVGSDDTLESLAAKYGTTAQAIVEANDLYDPILVAGMQLVIPGATGEALPAPKAPAPVKHTTGGGSSGGGSHSGGGGGTTTKPPYTGRLLWPAMAGGAISQRYHYGHYALDIAAPYGSGLRASGSGTVIFAGDKGYYGGGLSVWISLGGGLYLSYAHMARVDVVSGQSVSAGTRVGVIGMTGITTGPHVHYAVWRIRPFSQAASFSNTVNPCYYLGC